MLIRRLAPLALLALAAALVVSAPASAATRVNVPKTAKKAIDRIMARSDVAIYLPSSFTIRGSHPAYATGGATRNPRGWNIEFGYTRSCGANVCHMASFRAIVGGKPFGTARVRLARGVIGRFQPISCGASCSPAVIAFKLDGVLYEFSVKDPTGKVKPSLIALANQAIRYGPR